MKMIDCVCTPSSAEFQKVVETVIYYDLSASEIANFIAATVVMIGLFVIVIKIGMKM